MKRLKRLLWIPLLFLCSTLWAADSCEPIQLARMNPYIAGAGVAAATTNYCNDANAVGCWYMNSADGGDGSQTETDRTTNGNDLAVSASDTIPSSDTVPSGYGGNSRDFESGDGDYLSIADGTELDINGADAKLSICAWVKAESNPGDTNIYGIVVKHDTSSNNRQYNLGITGVGAGNFKFSFFTSASSANGSDASIAIYSTTTTYAAGNWYHICAVDNDTDNRIYVNGSLDSTPVAHTGGLFNGGATFYLGTASNTGAYFDGLIDEVIVLSRDLSSTEVSNIYTNGISGNKGGGD